jgi:hypothetical protein
VFVENYCLFIHREFAYSLRVQLLDALDRDRNVAAVAGMTDGCGSSSSSSSSSSSDSTASPMQLDRFACSSCTDDVRRYVDMLWFIM